MSKDIVSICQLLTLLSTTNIVDTMNQLEEQEYLPSAPGESEGEETGKGRRGLSRPCYFFSLCSFKDSDRAGFWMEVPDPPSSLKRKDFCDIHFLSLQQIFLKTPQSPFCLVDLCGSLRGTVLIKKHDLCSVCSYWHLFLALLVISISEQYEHEGKRTGSFLSLSPPPPASLKREE